MRKKVSRGFDYVPSTKPADAPSFDLNREISIGAAAMKLELAWLANRLNSMQNPDIYEVDPMDPNLTDTFTGLGIISEANMVGCRLLIMKIQIRHTVFEIKTQYYNFPVYDHRQCQIEIARFLASKTGMVTEIMRAYSTR